jgi:hypothetical protein
MHYTKHTVHVARTFATVLYYYLQLKVCVFNPFFSITIEHLTYSNAIEICIHTGFF